MPLSSVGWPLPGSGSWGRILGAPARIICHRLEAALLLTHTPLPSSSCGAIIHSDCQSKGLAFFCLSVILMLDTGRQGKAMAKTRQRGKPLRGPGHTCTLTASQEEKSAGGFRTAYLTLNTHHTTKDT